MVEWKISYHENFVSCKIFEKYCIKLLLAYMWNIYINQMSFGFWLWSHSCGISSCVSQYLKPNYCWSQASRARDIKPAILVLFLSSQEVDITKLSGNVTSFFKKKKMVMLLFIDFVGRQCITVCCACGGQRTACWSGFAFHHVDPRYWTQFA